MDGLSKSDVILVAKHQRFLMPLMMIAATSFVALLLLLFLALAEVFPVNDVTAIPIIGTVIIFELCQLISSYFVYRVGDKLYGWAVGLLIALSVVAGIVGWVVQIWFFFATSEVLKKHGLEVGLWGVDRRSLAAYAADEAAS